MPRNNNVFIDIISSFPRSHSTKSITIHHYYCLLLLLLAVLDSSTTGTISNIYIIHTNDHPPNRSYWSSSRSKASIPNHSQQQGLYFSTKNNNNNYNHNHTCRPPVSSSFSESYPIQVPSRPTKYPRK